MCAVFGCLAPRSLFVKLYSIPLSFAIFKEFDSLESKGSNPNNPPMNPISLPCPLYVAG